MTLLRVLDSALVVDPERATPLDEGTPFPVCSRPALALWEGPGRRHPDLRAHGDASYELARRPLARLSAASAASGAYAARCPPTAEPPWRRLAGGSEPRRVHAGRARLVGRRADRAAAVERRVGSPQERRDTVVAVSTAPLHSALR